MSWNEAHILAIDLEGSGDRASENPTLEIGAVLKSPNGKTLASFYEFGRCDPDQYEERCKKEFWNKEDKDGRKRKRYEDAQDQYSLWNKFYKWIQTCTKPFKNFIVISDNPAYDCAISSHNFDRYLHGETMHYVSGKKHKIRDVHSAVEPMALMCGMSRDDFEDLILGLYYKKYPDVEKSDHDHSAINDANKIANIWLAMIEFTKNNKFQPTEFVLAE